MPPVFGRSAAGGASLLASPLFPSKRDPGLIEVRKPFWLKHLLEALHLGETHQLGKAAAAAAAAATATATAPATATAQQSSTTSRQKKKKFCEIQEV